MWSYVLSLKKIFKKEKKKNPTWDLNPGPAFETKILPNI